MVDDVRWDVRYALRQFRQHPGFTAVAITMLALGIGVNAAVFTLTNGILFQRNSACRPDESHRVHLGDFAGASASYPDFEDWRAQATILRWQLAVVLIWRIANRLDDPVAVRAKSTTRLN